MSSQIVNFRPSGSHKWTQKAACAGDGIAPMFPHEQDADGIDYAKSICAGCPVIDTCLNEAMNRGEMFGVWGGMTAEERRALRRTETRKALRESKRSAAV